MFARFRTPRAPALSARLLARLPHAPWHPLTLPTALARGTVEGPHARAFVSPFDVPQAFQVATIGDAWIVRFRYLGDDERVRALSLSAGVWAQEGRHSGRLRQLQGDSPVRADRVVQAVGDWLSTPVRASLDHQAALLAFRQHIGQIVEASAQVPLTVEILARRAP